MKQTSQRAGTYVLQPSNYRAFVPSFLPPDPPVQIDDDLLQLLSSADQALGRLDGSTDVLPNPDLFVTMYIRKEAVLSSQIEGTQASLAEVLELEARVLDSERPTDAVDVVNYIHALDYGLERLSDLPLSLRLICEIHEKLMTGTRGHEMNPGEFRRSQNWIGPKGCKLTEARFVPPPDEMKVALGNLELFLHDESPMPLLMRVGLAHAQFETIHPFLDGNGRVGRLLITFLLCERSALKRPLLYLSYYFKQNRSEYYELLQNVRDRGDWERWLKFFLRGIAAVANEAATTARRIVAMREEHRDQIIEIAGRTTPDALRLHEQLFRYPIVSASSVQILLGNTFPAANGLLKRLESMGILREVTGRSRRKAYLYEAYFRLFDDAEFEAENVVPAEGTITETN